MTDLAQGEPQAAEPIVASQTPTPESTQKTESKHKLKINGKDVEVPYEELVKYAQKGEAADLKFREASKLQSQYQEFQKKLESGELEELLEKVPADKKRQFAESYLLKFLEEQELPESEKELRKLKKQLEQTEAEKKRLADEKAESEKAAVMQQAYKEIDEEIGESLKAMGKKPTPRLVARIAETMLAHLEAKGERLGANDALSQSLDEINQDSVEYIKGLSVEELRKLLPKETLEMLRKAQVEEVMAQDPLRSRQRQTQAAPKLNGKPKRMTSDEYFKQLESRLGG